MRRLSLGEVVLALGLSAMVLPDAGSAAAATCTAGPGTVCTESGAVRGVAEGNTLAFKGIPYAKPPVGDLRWRPPQPPEPWAGVRDGSQFGAICPQLNGKEVVGTEDCLTVNVWQPRDARPEDRRPVMVWFTGGGNHSLSGRGSAQYGGVTYDGQALAERAGVVFVSFNYRLGALGFLAHAGGGRDRIAGNYGTQDQIALLGWVKRNIAQFGGDPQRVMGFGTSAGGANLCALMAAPAAKGLLHAAAMHSSVPTGCELPSRAEAEKGTGARVAAALGCSGPDAAACLRAKPMAEVVSAVPGTFGIFPRLYGPVVDRRVIPEQPIRTIRAGKHHAMPVIVGNSSEETMQFVDAAGPVTDRASYAAAVEKVFGAKARDAVLARYPEGSYPSPRRAFVQATTDALFTCRNLGVARELAARQSQPVYRSIFAHALENDPAMKAAGINHTIEHPFFFNWAGTYRPTEADRAVQGILLDGWSNLARSGNPNGGAVPSWPAATARDPSPYLLIGATGATAERGPDAANCDFWRRTPLPWPHL